MMGFHVLLQVLLKGSFDYLLDFMLYLQLIKCIPIYDLNIPANVLVVLKQLRNIIEFDALKPENLLPFIWSEEELKKLDNSMMSFMTTS